MKIKVIIEGNWTNEAFWFEYDGEPGSEIRSAAITWIRGRNE